MTPQLRPHMDQIQRHSLQTSFKQSGINQLDVMRRGRESGQAQGNDIRHASEWRCWECFPEPCVDYLGGLHTIIKSGARAPLRTLDSRSVYVLCCIRGAGCSSDKTADNMVGRKRVSWDAFHVELCAHMMRNAFTCTIWRRWTFTFKGEVHPKILCDCFTHPHDVGESSESSEHE